MAQTTEGYVATQIRLLHLRGDMMAGLIHILENGFEMFNGPEDARAQVADQLIVRDSDEEDQNEGGTHYVELMIEHNIARDKTGVYSMERKDRIHSKKKSPRNDRLRQLVFVCGSRQF